MSVFLFYILCMTLIFERVMCDRLTPYFYVGLEVPAAIKVAGSTLVVLSSGCRN
jgi:hypothetical protein